LRFGCDHHGCLDQHALSCAKARFAQCVHRQVSKVVLADDLHDLSLPRVPKTFHELRDLYHSFALASKSKPVCHISHMPAGLFCNFRIVEIGARPTETGGPFWNPHFVVFEDIVFVVAQNGESVLVPNFGRSWVWPL